MYAAPTWTVSTVFRKKEKRERYVELIKPAAELMELILQDTTGCLAQQIEVTQRDNLTSESECVTFLFRDWTTGMAWHLTTWMNGSGSPGQVQKVSHQGHQPMPSYVCEPGLVLPRRTGVASETAGPCRHGHD